MRQGEGEGAAPASAGTVGPDLPAVALDDAPELGNIPSETATVGFPAHPTAPRGRATSRWTAERETQARVNGAKLSDSFFGVGWPLKSTVTCSSSPTR